MKITLNQANKLRKKLERLTIKITSTVPLSTDDENYKDTWNTLRQNFFKDTADYLNSVEVTQELRNLIFEANVRAGINETIAKIVLNRNLVKAYDSLVSKFSSSYNISTIEQFERKLKHREAVALADPTNIMEHLDVNVALLDTEDKEMFSERKQELILVCEELEEKRNALNHATQIELPENVVKFLREHNLVK